MPVDWQTLQSRIKTFPGNGSPHYTTNRIPEDVKTELELQCSEMGMSTPTGYDYSHDKLLSEAELEHAKGVSKGYELIIEIILKLANDEEDAEPFEALSECGFLKRIVNIQPALCNQQTSTELLDCLAMVKKRQ